MPDPQLVERFADLVVRVGVNVQPVEGLVLTVAGGRITDLTATAGADPVRAQLDTDEGARSLGGRVGASGLTRPAAASRHRPRRPGTVSGGPPPG
ncbi:aminopeptidase [Plantactinospora sp. GCM10030261]|uniref:aminopeptidase n=1 Tax=Plantactinospora sp. GCM10030261 TaxID=3273420 RepID=UPI003611B73B